MFRIRIKIQVLLYIVELTNTMFRLTRVSYYGRVWGFELGDCAIHASIPIALKMFIDKISINNHVLYSC